ncbi:MAG: hypothetical protein ACYDCD_00630 [Candidatus Acidiferrales bacterium]
MHGRRYYLTTLGAWRRHAARCAETHFVTVNVPEEQSGQGSVASQQADGRNGVSDEQTQAKACATDDATPILALIDADEGAHLAMENDAEFEELPHPLARTPVSKRVSVALAPFGVVHGDDTFIVTEKLARVNPLLRHRVF